MGDKSIMAGLGLSAVGTLVGTMLMSYGNQQWSQRKSILGTTRCGDDAYCKQMRSYALYGTLLFVLSVIPLMIFWTKVQRV